MIRPVLKKSDPTVGIVTPASAVEESLLHAALPAMERKGWHVRLGKNVYKRNRFCAGSDEERADDLHEFFKDENIDMIIAARGGYGTARLLPIIDFGLIAAHPKPFVGLSDTTAFQNALLKKCNIVTFSGFVPACDIRDERFMPVTEASLDDVLSGKEQRFSGVTLYSGTAEGMLAGGCLTLMETLIGTPFFPDLNGAVLLLEDVGEDPYRIDRMMTHLFLAGAFNRLAGIVFGEFFRCSPKDKNDGTVDDVLEEWADKLKIPALKNIIYGHQPNHCVVPLGGVAKIENSTLIVS